MNEPPELKIYSHYIHQLLQEYTQEGLAEALGVNATSIQRWHRGASTPHPNHRVNILNLSKVTTGQVKAWWDFW